MSDAQKSLSQALWRIFRRPGQPTPWLDDGNLPWDDPAFSERMLSEHLDQTHGAASRIESERHIQIDWLWSHLGLRPGARILDVTCGPGLYAVDLAARGCQVLGVDFSPASIAYARELAHTKRVSDRCLFIEADVRQMALASESFDAALFIYGQMAVFPRQEARKLLLSIANALRPEGKLCIELLEPERVDKGNSSWWHTGEGGLWSHGPYLHLGERFWVEEERCSVERFHVLHLDDGQFDEITLCDQTYSIDEMRLLLASAEFDRISVHPAWDGLPLYDAAEWNVYVASQKA